MPRGKRLSGKRKLRSTSPDMASEGADQPSSEDVSFADVLEDGDAASAAAGKGQADAAMDDAAPANGDDAEAEVGDDTEPMEVMEGQPGAAGDAPAASDAATPAGDAEAAPDAAEKPAETTDAAASAEEAKPAEVESEPAAEPEKDSGETEAPASEAADKPAETADAAAEKPAETAEKPAESAEAAADKPAAATAAKPAAGKPTPPAKGGKPTAAGSRPIPADAEPIREFSSATPAVAGPKPKSPSPEPLTELQKLWKPVKQNPADFTAWTLLIQYVENQCFMEDIRSVLKAFLARYPYCYGYWKKYTDLEKKRGTAELCQEVFDAGLAAVPLSVDLWLHYLNHLRATYEDKPEMVRAGFERAIAACGMEFRSDRLWEQYASWETTNKEPVKALAVYKRAIAVPTLSYRTHFENLEQFVGETPPQELLTVEQFLEARRAVLAELRASEPAAAAPPPSTDLLPPGCDEPPPGVPAQPAGLSSDEECVKLRAKILAPLRKLHKDTEKQVSLRWNYEEGIKRPYFHVKPLEKAQLKNWKAYLDFEIEQGDKSRVRILFERCMIACALYEEYWMKYIKYLESSDPPSPEEVRAVYKRACWTHLPDKPALHLMWAAFEEKHGNMDAAAEVLKAISSKVTMLEVSLRMINLARRAGRLDEAEELYADQLKRTQHRESAVIIAIKFVRFLYKIRDNYSKAEDVLREAIRLDSTNMRLYMQMVDLGFQQRPVNVTLIREAFQLAMEAPFDEKEKLTLAHRRMEFLEEFDNDAESLQKAYEEYCTLLKAAKAEAKKKKVEEEAEAATKTTPGKRSAPSANGPLFDIRHNTSTCWWSQITPLGHLTVGVSAGLVGWLVGWLYSRSESPPRPLPLAGGQCRISQIMRFGFPGRDNVRLQSDFVLAYDPRQRVPQWVYEHLTPESVRRNDEVDRAGCAFTADESIHPYFRAENSDYKGSGYDRGHMAAAANHLVCQQHQQETFLLSNMAPQVGEGFNRDKWNDLEMHVRKLCKFCPNVYVFTGPLYLPRREADGKLRVTYEVIGRNQVAVPTHFYKVVVAESESGHLDMEAYVMPNRRIPNDTPINNFLVAPDVIERAAGLFFFEKMDRSRLKRINGRKTTWLSQLRPRDTTPCTLQKEEEGENDNSLMIYLCGAANTAL